MSLFQKLGCISLAPARSTVTSRLYRPCRSPQSLHSLRLTEWRPKLISCVMFRTNSSRPESGYMLTGSMAMNYYAQPRMTRDIDVVVAIKPNDVDRVVALF